jgi:hypothetical protein
MEKYLFYMEMGATQLRWAEEGTLSICIRNNYSTQLINNKSVTSLQEHQIILPQIQIYEERIMKSDYSFTDVTVLFLKCYTST